MSIQLINEAFETDLDYTARFVLVALADHVNADQPNKGCWPSVGTIHKKTGISNRAIQLALRRLEKLGHISITKRTGTSSRYLVHPQAPTRGRNNESRKTHRADNPSFSSA